MNYQQYNAPYECNEHDESDGWVLYYSPEGYPYYYNTYTGDSQWAEYNETYNQDTGNEIDQSQSVSDEEHEYSDEYSSQSDDEKEFEEYMQTTEGQQRYEKEQRYVERYMERQSFLEAQALPEPPFQWQESESYSSQYGETLSAEEAAQFISTYGLPPPPQHSLPLDQTEKKVRFSRSVKSRADIEGGRSSSGEEGSEEESDISSVSTEDPDVKTIRAPLVPVWISSSTTMILGVLDRIFRAPVAAAFNTLIRSFTTEGRVTSSQSTPTDPVPVIDSTPDNEAAVSVPDPQQPSVDSKRSWGWEPLATYAATNTWKYLLAASEYIVDGDQNEAKPESLPP